jgi:hypothetical protein
MRRRLPAIREAVPQMPIAVPICFQWLRRDLVYYIIPLGCLQPFFANKPEESSISGENGLAVFRHGWAWTEGRHPFIQEKASPPS